MPRLDDNPGQIQVIVPAHRAEATIGRCLTALFAAGFPPDAVLVVDDGSPDRTGEIARETGVEVRRNETPKRPAEARNSGAEGSEADILLFVDSDVVVHPGLRDRIVAHFTDPTLSAVIGSYDDRPAGPVVSRYRNLLHHVTHQDAAGETRTFWSGIGAMRRSVFEAVEGYDPEWEDIEDVELGLRVTEAGGRILLDPDMLGTHLKTWTVRSMFRTDLWGRAVPWTRLIAEGRLDFQTLNAALKHRVSALCVLVAFLSLPAVLISVQFVWLLLGALIVFLGVNLRMLQRFARIDGIGFAASTLPYHALHYVAAILGYAWVRLFDRRA
jgi:glycosyltransferase involved in cell wall biosynthesis